MAQTKAPKESAVDWDAMEPEWRAGIISVAELSRRYKVSRTGITKHWAKLKIDRDLTAKIQAEATTLVQRAEVSGDASVAPEPASDAGAAKPTDSQTVGFNARMQATVILRQRRDVATAQDIAGELLAELKAQTFDRAHFAQLVELLRKAAKSGKVSAKDVAPLMQLAERVGSTAARVDMFKKLSEAMKLMTELERRVLSIADDTPVDPEERVKQAVASGLAELKARFKARGVKV